MFHGHTPFYHGDTRYFQGDMSTLLGDTAIFHGDAPLLLGGMPLFHGDYATLGVTSSLVIISKMIMIVKSVSMSSKSEYRKKRNRCLTSPKYNPRFSEKTL